MSFHSKIVARWLGIAAVLVAVVAVSAGWILTNPEKLDVVLSDGAIEIADSALAGETVFQIVNEGEMPHSFEVTRVADPQANEVASAPTKVAALTTNVGPGESTTLAAILEPGTYEVFCPLDGHRDQGMSERLVVVEESR